MIQLLIKNSPVTYASFRAWLTKIYNNDILKVKKFESMSDIYLIPVFTKYLEEELKIPILDALNYYTKLRFIIGYNNQVKSMIQYEFIRIELRKEIEYNIF